MVSAGTYVLASAKVQAARVRELDSLHQYALVKKSSVFWNIGVSLSESLALYLGPIDSHLVLWLNQKL